MEADSVTTYYRKCIEQFGAHKDPKRFCQCLCNPAHPNIGTQPNCYESCMQCLGEILIRNPCDCLCSKLNQGDWRAAKECRKQCEKLNSCETMMPFIPKCDGTFLDEFAWGLADLTIGCKQMNEFPSTKCIGGMHYKYICNKCPTTIICCPCCRQGKLMPHASKNCRLGWNN